MPVVFDQYAYTDLPYMVGKSLEVRYFILTTANPQYRGDRSTGRILQSVSKKGLHKATDSNVVSSLVYIKRSFDIYVNFHEDFAKWLHGCGSWRRWNP